VLSTVGKGGKMTEGILLTDEEYMVAEDAGTQRWHDEGCPNGKFYPYRREAVERAQVAKVVEWMQCHSEGEGLVPRTMSYRDWQALCAAGGVK